MDLIYKKTDQDICNLRIVVNAGSFRETRFGAAHYLEHMFFKGTNKRGYKELNALASRLGDINAYTGNEQTVYTIDFLADDFEQAADLLFEMVLDPAFPEDEFEKERGVILQERQARLDNPSVFASDTFWQDLHGDLGHPIIGTEADIKAMKVDDLKAFRQRWYGDENKKMVLVGNLSPGRAYPYVGLHDGNPIAPGVETKLNLKRLDFHHASTQAMLMIGWPGISCDEECMRHQMPDILANAIGQGMHSLLFDRIREELGLCYSIGAYHASYRSTGLFLVWCLLDADQIPRVTDEIHAILERVCANGIPEELFVTAKRNYLFGVCERFQSAGMIARSADACFSLSRPHLEELMTLASRKEQINGLHNYHLTEFARDTFGAGRPFKYATMTEA